MAHRKKITIFITRGRGKFIYALLITIIVCVIELQTMNIYYIYAHSKMIEGPGQVCEKQNVEPLITLSQPSTMLTHLYQN